MIFFENQGVLPFRSVEISPSPVNISNDPNKTQVDWTKVKKPDFKAVMNILSKVNRIYEDDTWVIDLIGGNVRVSYFEEGHFVDEIILTGDDFKE